MSLVCCARGCLLASCAKPMQSLAHRISPPAQPETTFRGTAWRRYAERILRNNGAKKVLSQLLR
eukprot:3902946-Pyramimonas_sp.AAC.1